MAAEARRRGCTGVVCGHIHKAELRSIDGILYCNDGDWVESLTALVELDTGELKLVNWKGESLAHTAGNRRMDAADQWGRGIAEEHHQMA
jgi:predicted phosphodiesterase